jgi:hypothetical protein
MDNVNARQTLQHFRDLLHPNSMPTHVFQRIDALAAGDVPEYIDAKTYRDSDNKTYGVAIAYTSRTIIQANWIDEPAFERPSRDAATAIVACWSRSKLSELEIGSDEKNFNTYWAEYSGESWPQLCQIKLKYEGRTEDVNLPLQPYPGQAQLAQLHSLIRGLLSDLNA